MRKSDAVTIHTDGAARGNPGPAAFGFVVSRNGSTVTENAELLGETTNNVAEYTALIKALEEAKRQNWTIGEIFTDSELMVKQIHGKYRVKNEGLKPLHGEIISLLDDLDAPRTVVSHVPRNKNKRADELCNKALDAAAGGKKTGSSSKSKKKKTARTDVREDAVDCLRAAAMAWSCGNPNDPDPVLVWDQLWSILQEGNALR